MDYVRMYVCMYVCLSQEDGTYLLHAGKGGNWNYELESGD